MQNVGAVLLFIEEEGGKQMSPKITRRDFLKVSGGVTGLFATAGLFRGPLKEFETKLVDTRPRWSKEVPTICPYDASGCGFICYTDSNGNLVNLEGDPDHPINRGGACSKGASLAQLHNGDEIKLGHLIMRADFYHPGNEI